MTMQVTIYLLWLLSAPLAAETESHHKLNPELERAINEHFQKKDPSESADQLQELLELSESPEELEEKLEELEKDPEEKEALIKEIKKLLEDIADKDDEESKKLRHELLELRDRLLGDPPVGDPPVSPPGLKEPPIKKEPPEDPVKPQDTIDNEDEALNAIEQDSRQKQGPATFGSAGPQNSPPSKISVSPKRTKTTPRVVPTPSDLQ